ncbi:MAG: hypothetical protein MUO53_17680 [Maribacter sp.]|nr:hypothetical protein [Maribacter sp.]
MNKKVIYQDLVKEEKDLLEELEKVRGLKNYYEDKYGFNVKSQKKIEFVEAENNSVAVMDGYDKAWTYEDKTLFFLKQNKHLTSTELAALLFKHEEGKIDLERAGKAARSKLSTLYKQKRIGASLIGQGNKRRYYLKENAPT